MSAYPVVETITIADAYIEWALATPRDLSDDGDVTALAPGGVWKNLADNGVKERIVRYVRRSSRIAADDGPFLGVRIINNRILYEIHTYLVTMVGKQKMTDRTPDLKAGAGLIKRRLHLRSSSEGTADFTEAGLVDSHFITGHDEFLPLAGGNIPELGGYFEIKVQPIAT